MSTIDFIDNHIFKKDFNENYSKLQSHVRKAFESTLEATQTNNLGDLSCYSSDYEDEEMFTNHGTLKLWANNEEVEVPADLINIHDIKDILNKEVFDELSAEEQQHLRSLLPQDGDQDQILDDLFSGKTVYHVNPLESFLEGVKAGCFTKTFEKEQQIEDRLSKIYLRNYYDNITSFLNLKFEELQQKQNQGQHQPISNLIKRSAAFDLEDISEDSGISIDSINDLKVENSLDEISDGETEPEMIHEDLKMELLNELDDEILETRRVETQKIITSEPFKPKKVEVEPIMVSSSSAAKSKHNSSKNFVTIKPRGSLGEWVDRYREQETDRYNNPTRPWVYHLPEGGSAIVAPVAKKISVAQNSKPREHFLLKGERPSYITILCLVRDAAARLPNGEGTRADICELLKESQYINETIPDDKLSTVVSGALDRLHYEDDPCVKYDQDKKLWMYLHKDRTEDYGPWIDQTESRSSKKKEYNQKYKITKKLKAEDKSVRSETDTNTEV